MFANFRIEFENKFRFFAVAVSCYRDYSLTSLRGNITVRLTLCFTGFDLTKQENMFSI